MRILKDKDLKPHFLASQKKAKANGNELMEALLVFIKDDVRRRLIDPLSEAETITYFITMLIPVFAKAFEILHVSCEASEDTGNTANGIFQEMVDGLRVVLGVPTPLIEEEKQTDSCKPSQRLMQTRLTDYERAQLEANKIKEA